MKTKLQNSIYKLIEKEYPNEIPDKIEQRVRALIKEVKDGN